MDATQEPRRGYAIAGAAVLGLGVLVEATRIVLNRPIPGMNATADFVVSGALCLLWSACAAALVRRPKHGSVGMVSRVLALAGPYSMLGHGAVTRIAGSTLGIGFIAAGLLLMFLTKRAWLGRQATTLDPGASDEPSSAVR